MYVVKRDGTRVPFDKNKIINAINKAFIEVDGCLYEDDTSNEIADEIYNLGEEKTLTVEEIQDLIEDILMQSERRDVARSYVRYRYKKEVARDCKADFFEAIGEKLQGKNIQNNNANMDEASFGGRIGEASNVMTKQYALEFLVSKMAKANHEGNMIYIHDLDSYSVGSHNCLSIPFDDLLANGFNTRQGDVRPASSLSTACQLIAVIFQLQSLQQFGGVSATHLDWTLVPYVRKSFFKHYKNGVQYIDNKEIDYSFHNGLSIDESDYKIYSPKAYEYAMEMTKAECAQAMEALFHNLNTLQSRSGCQLPFTSVNAGTCALPEGRMVIKGLLEACLKGIGKFHRTSIFPCVIFQCMKGVNRKPGEPNYDLYRLALKCTAHRLYPNYANCDWSGNAGYDLSDPRTYFSTMGK